MTSSIGTAVTGNASVNVTRRVTSTGRRPAAGRLAVAVDSSEHDPHEPPEGQGDQPGDEKRQAQNERDLRPLGLSVEE